MRTTLALVAATFICIGSTGCATRPLRSMFHRGAPCASAVTPTYSAPIVSGPSFVETSAGCTTCGTAECTSCGGFSGTVIPYGTEAVPAEGIVPGPG